jgi:hypothetical protein
VVCCDEDWWQQPDGCAGFPLSPSLLYAACLPLQSQPPPPACGTRDGAEDEGFYRGVPGWEAARAATAMLAVAAYATNGEMPNGFWMCRSAYPIQSQDFGSCGSGYLHLQNGSSPFGLWII